MTSMGASRRRLTSALVLAATCAAAVAGCGSGGGSSSAPGVTKDAVTIGSHQPLTGPAAPGYSEIAPASNAFFKFLNSQGGVKGRQIKYIYKDDGYNPTNTVAVTKRLVLQDKVFAIFNGLGTPTHTKVADFLNASKVPDLFVASGCQCWDEPDQHPMTFGWQPDYVVEGKILGDYIKKNFSGKKVAYFYQDDDFGKDGVKGLDMYIPKSQVVSRQAYQPGDTNMGPQISAIKSSGAEVVAAFTIPAYTALAELTSVKLGYKAQFVVSNVGSDPITVGGLLKSFSKGKAGASLIEGLVTDGYLPAVGDTSNPWISLFKRVHDRYDKKAPFDGNVLYGMAAAYTFAQALDAAGDNPTRQDLVDAVEKGNFRGPGLVPFRYSDKSHAGYTGAQIGTIKNGKIAYQGTPVTTDDGGGPLKPYTKKQPTPEEGGVVKPGD
jgi:ABC-type branched-subunit amino acid transport system substrate-binding protein